MLKEGLNGQIMAAGCMNLHHVSSRVFKVLRLLTESCVEAIRRELLTDNPTGRIRLGKASATTSPQSDSHGNQIRRWNES